MPSESVRGSTMGSIATGQAEAALSTYDTQMPWWHVLGLRTPRVRPDYCWYENSPRARTLKLPKARIAITWLKNDDAAAASSVPHRRSAQGAENGKLDLAVVAEWLKACDTEHQEECYFDKERRTPLDIRLINLATREIENADTDFRYATLSYVWGSQLKTRHGQEAEDSRSGRELGRLSQTSQTRRLPKQLPATLEDAITIASALGEQYLWIDLFCIDQSIEDELESQIRRMNIIYQSATFTIIARDGEDAYAGIAGISRPMKLWAQPTCELPNGTLMATALRPVAGNVGKSPWDKPDKNAWDNVYSIDLRAPEWSLRNFNNLLSVYTSRLLKYPSDILSACKGALAELEARTGQKFNDYGIPLNDTHCVLHIASRMAFCTLQKRRRDKDSHPTGSFSSATPTLLTTTSPDPGVGTLVKADVGYLWTIVSPSAPHRPMIDLANNAEEPHVFDETNYFLRLSREDSHELLEQRGSGQGQGQQNRLRGQVLLVQVHDLPLVRDSEVHNWWLADMGADDLTKWKRLGALLLEKEVFDGFKPANREVDVV
ncbi:hypothetical protein DV737_g1534, partial [Chaetothyriales sp. CBS 132003]